MGAPVLTACRLLRLSSMRPNEESARVAPGSEATLRQAENLLGDLCALFRQVGSPEVSTDPTVASWTATVDSLPALNRFLEDYVNRLLLPMELPAIVTASGHARRGEWRDLLAQDLRLAEAMRPTPFAEPSRRMGRMQLLRLRPLRDERTVQRYLAAVESGQAHGWHTMVYGVTLAVYSLPLRQALLYYLQETISALASAAGRSKNFGELELAQMLSGLLERVPAAVEVALLSAESVSRFSKDVETDG
jgi:urease accessory protein UreF